MTAPLTIRKLSASDYPEGIRTSQDLERLGNLLNPILEGAKQLSARGVAIGQNLDATLSTFSIKTPSTDWITVAGGIGFTNGWVAYVSSQSVPRYRTLPDGTIEVEGYVSSGTVGTSPFTLPVVFRPTTDKTFITLGSTGPAAQVAVRSEVMPNGTIIGSTAVPGTTLTNDFWGLDGIRFANATNAPGILSCFPFQVRVQDRRRPRAALLLSCQDSMNANPPNTPNVGPTPSILAPGLQWSFVQSGDGNNYLSIDGMPGLALGRTYSVNVLVLY